MLRRVAQAVAVASVLLFVVTFVRLVNGDVPSSCIGSDCLHGTNRWVLAVPGSILLFVASVLTASFTKTGMGRPQGPRTWAEVDSGAAALAPVRPDPPPPTKRWTRSWRNIYGATAGGELLLAALFVYGGIAEPDSRGGAFFTAAILGSLGLGIGYAGWRMAGKDKLHETGLRGTARLLSVRQTGMWMNNNPVVVLDLAVSVGDKPTYEVRHRETVPAIAVGRLTQGDTFDVKVNAHNPSDLIVDW
jgi:hypothetical protein